MLSDEVEFDEKYFVQSHKGKKIEGLPGKKRGTKASKRGLSDEQVCILCGVQRLGKHFSHAYNMAKPSTEDVMNLKEHLKDNSFVWIDGLTSYNRLLEEKHCKKKVVKTYTEYDKVNHLNNVNSFHEKIQKQYEIYRGVASKYINRYCALFNLQREYAGMDNQEFIQLILNRLRNISDYFFVKQIVSDDLFDPFTKMELSHQIAG